jgi:uncharacterized membrane-anchored protein
MGFAFCGRGCDFSSLISIYRFVFSGALFWLAGSGRGMLGVRGFLLALVCRTETHAVQKHGIRKLLVLKNKLPQITLLFWIMKIAATTLGETAGDLLSMTLKVGYAVSSLILIGFFLGTVVTQLMSKRYHPLLYWAVILSTSTAGTTMSDYMDRTLGLGYAKGTLILITILGAIFLYWRSSAHSFSVQNITTFHVELLYWTAILFSNTLGTALGDFLADSSGLGFAGGALLIGGLLTLTVLAAYFTPVSKTLLFWIAFVLTRPFGATMGDVLTKSHEKGGLNFGTIGSSIVLGSILVILILYAIIKQNKETKAA